MERSDASSHSVVYPLVLLEGIFSPVFLGTAVYQTPVLLVAMDGSSVPSKVSFSEFSSEYDSAARHAAL